MKTPIIFERYLRDSGNLNIAYGADDIYIAQWMQEAGIYYNEDNFKRCKAVAYGDVCNPWIRSYVSDEAMVKQFIKAAQELGLEIDKKDTRQLAYIMSAVGIQVSVVQINVMVDLLSKKGF